MSLLKRKKNGIDRWISTATDKELKDGYEKRRLEWMKNGFGGNGEITPAMKKISAEITKREAEKWKNNPKRNNNPNFHWTDANRWEKD